MHSTVQC